jgi:MGT family glycosyltransferase
MARVLCYTSPARGHLYPTVPVLLELARRGHDVALATLSSEVARMNAAGLRTRAVDSRIEEVAHDDWGARTPLGALDRAASVFVARARHEIPDLGRAIATERPDGVLVDFNCWGAGAAAERTGLPWALFLPYFLPWRLPGLPPFGPGLAPRADVLGRLRDAVAGEVVERVLDRNLPALNAVRARVGLSPLRHVTDLGRTAPRILHYTAEPFDYACPARPPSVVAVGPCAWEPPADPPPWLAAVAGPLVLVTCSTELQDDARLVSVALEALPGDGIAVVATTAAADPARFDPPAGAHVARFLAHGPLLRRAAAVVCHGGMGITQKALAAGVPVCVVPFGRDQLEVARHVEVAGAGVRLSPRRLTPARLRAAVAAARSCRAGAERIATAFRAAGGPTTAADALEELLPTGRAAAGPAAHPAHPTGGHAGGAGPRPTRAP